MVIALSFSYSRAWALRPQSRLLGDLFSEKSEHRFTIPVEKWPPHVEMRVCDFIHIMAIGVKHIVAVHLV